jgi:hypothetical protein
VITVGRHGQRVSGSCPSAGTRRAHPRELEARCRCGCAPKTQALGVLPMFLRGDAEEHIPVGSRRAIHGAPRPAPEHRQDAQYHRPPCVPVVACTGVQRSRRAPLGGMERSPGAHCRPRHRPQPQHPRPRRDRGVGRPTAPFPQAWTKKHHMISCGMFRRSAIAGSRDSKSPRRGA